MGKDYHLTLAYQLSETAGVHYALLVSPNGMIYCIRGVLVGAIVRKGFSILQILPDQQARTGWRMKNSISITVLGQNITTKEKKDEGKYIINGLYKWIDIPSWAGAGYVFPSFEVAGGVFTFQRKMPCF